MSDTPRTEAAWSQCVALEARTPLRDLSLQLERELNATQSENTRLRAALATSKSPCVYCSLPSEEWSKCKSGFPGCGRADDAMGCPELGASIALDDLKVELDAANERIKRLEEALDTITAVIGLTPILGNKKALQEALDASLSVLRGKEPKP